MKIIGLMLAATLCLTLVAQADTYTLTTNILNGAALALSEQIPISGVLDAIEMRQDASATTTVTVATYDAASNAVTTFATFSALTARYKLIRPRVVGTGTTGTDLAAVYNGGGTGVTQILSVPYERMTVGGNLRAAITATANAGTNALSLTFFYLPTIH